MSAKHEIGAKLTLKDNMSATLKGVRKEQNNFRKDISETRKAIESAYKKKLEMKLDNSNLHIILIFVG
jgi:hypothetical protein